MLSGAAKSAAAAERAGSRSRPDQAAFMSSAHRKKRSRATSAAEAEGSAVAPAGWTAAAVSPVSESARTCSSCEHSWFLSVGEALRIWSRSARAFSSAVSGVRSRRSDGRLPETSLGQSSVSAFATCVTARPTRSAFASYCASSRCRLARSSSRGESTSSSTAATASSAGATSPSSEGWRSGNATFQISTHTSCSSSRLPAQRAGEISDSIVRTASTRTVTISRV
eukprot:scaffold40390_cov26-Tisochrysis_lutea.AAC.4